MKKIVSAAAAGALLLGAASAEIGIKGNFRIRANAYSQVETEQEEKTTRVTDLDGYGSSADNFTFSAKNDYANVNLVTLPTNANNAITVDTKYWGGLRFGKLNFTAGKFESVVTPRLNAGWIESSLLDDSNVKNFGLSKNLITDVNIKETYTKLVVYEKDTPSADVYTLSTKTYYDEDGNELTGEYYTLAAGKGEYKSATVYVKEYTGSATLAAKNDDTAWLIDFNNISAVAGTRVLSFIADYTVDDVADGKLLFKVGLFDSSFKVDEEDADDKKYFDAGYSFDISLQRKDFTIEALARLFTEDRYGFGLYFNTAQLIPMTKLSFGFTYGIQKENEDNGLAKMNAFAIDLHTQHALTKELNAGFQAKYSYVKYDEADDPFSGLDLVAGVEYTLSDLVNLGFDAGLYFGDLGKAIDADVGATYFKLRPAAEFKAGAGAKITTAVEYSRAISDGDAKDAGINIFNKQSIKIPVILRVKL